MMKLMIFLLVHLVRIKANRPEEQLKLFLTSKDNLTELFIDGQEIQVPLHRPWNVSLEFVIHQHTRLLAIRSTSVFETNCPGVLGSIGGYFLTSNKTCKCAKSGGINVGHLGYDDSYWNASVVVGRNNGEVPGCPSMTKISNISTDAQWVWTNVGDEVVAYCRCYLPLCEARNPCQNKGTCQKNNLKLCVCQPGYAGTYCQLTTCEKENPCKNNGKCIIEDDTKLCKCTPNYLGWFCEIPSCALDNPCENNGTCGYLNNTKICTCPPFVWGQFCEIDKRDPCTKEPCLNNGVCISSKPVNNSYSGEYKCVCPFSFTGRHCEFQVLNHSLQITAKELLNAVYVDGVRLHPLQNDNIWNKTTPIVIPNYSRLLAIMASDINSNCAGILASSLHDYLLTGLNWKCHYQARLGWWSLGYNETLWPAATITGINDQIGIRICKSGTVKGMPNYSKWIWTDQNTNHDMVVYCRGYIDTCKSKPCHNGGRCNNNHPLLCNCSPGYSGMFCEKVTFKTLKVTAKESIEALYVDDSLKKVYNGSSWSSVDSFSLHPLVRLVAILVTDVTDLRSNCSGILSSENLNWKCASRATAGWYKLGFNDGHWTTKKNIGINENGGRCPDVIKPVQDISPQSHWFWTEPISSLISYCRGYFPICSSHPCHNGGKCNSNLPKLCTCPPNFTGTYCELEIGVDVPENDKNERHSNSFNTQI